VIAVNRLPPKAPSCSFTLVDAVSFELMKGRGVTHAFAFDAHFHVAGYEMLDVM